MQLIPHPWTNLVHAWSSRLMALCVVLQLVEPVAADFVEEYITGQSFWTRVAMKIAVAAVGVAAIWAKIVFQQKLQDKLEQKDAEQNAKQQG